MTYDGDIASNLRGGAMRGTAYVGNLFLSLLLDGRRLLGWPGVTLFLDGLSIHGGNPSALAGDAQGVSDLAAKPTLELYEAWLQYNTHGSRLSLLAGRYDLNSEFYSLSTSAVFLNSSFGIGPEFAKTGRAGPSIFPDTSLGVRLAYRPSSDLVARAAVLDAAPPGWRRAKPPSRQVGGGVLLVTELALLTRPGPGVEPGKSRSLIGRISAAPPYEDKVAVGAWYYTASFRDLSTVGTDGRHVLHRGNGGAYLLIDHRLFRDRNDRSRHVAGFVQAGVADPRVDRFGSYLGLGAVAAGLVPGRPHDEFGLATAVARNGSHYRARQEARGKPVSPFEIAIESMYIAKLEPWIAIKPDLQYIIHPDSDPRRANALVFQLEFEISP